MLKYRTKDGILDFLASLAIVIVESQLTRS